MDKTIKFIRIKPKYRLQPAVSHTRNYSQNFNVFIYNETFGI